MVTIWVDADGCPVVNQTIQAAVKYQLDVWLVCDTSHEYHREGAKTLVVSKGADSADFVLVNRIHKNDIVITQDYGLAAMCLAKQAVVMNQDGLQYNEFNMDSLLLARHTARKIRNSGGRLKGPSKRTEQQNQIFSKVLEQLIVKQLEI